MEEEKAAAYYDELTRKGEGAARFKRGLGFSSCDDQHDTVPQRGTTFVSPCSSFLSSFVRASSPTTASKLEKESQLQSIQHKLKKKPEREARVSARTNVERDGDKHSRRRSSSTKIGGVGVEIAGGGVGRLVEKGNWSGGSGAGVCRRGSHGGVMKRHFFCEQLPPERVKAKMKLQLAEAAEKDPTTGPGWERFEFDKDAPVDDDEIEGLRETIVVIAIAGLRETIVVIAIAVAEDDASLVKHIGQSFRFSAIEKRREEQLKAAHDEAIFGTSTASLSVTADSEPEEENLKKDSNDNAVATGLLSEKVSGFAVALLFKDLFAYCMRAIYDLVISMVVGASKATRFVARSGS
ncbi:hypothetical protein GOBAR_AA07903 [Gossypium barbadense]|uniref:Uncharacterized protein n=1 Tax=Gossypium barbadense TaxID=3634 RepID=A0A2P5YAW1_GOSBA|nr:hypothetical protein GOBAR_AA07903 [Gossypium barbadense]